MCRCLKCERAWAPEELAGAPGEEVVRCPACEGRILEKLRPERTRTVKAR